MAKEKIAPILEEIQSLGFRQTRARKAILEVLWSADGWLRPEEVLHRARSISPSLGIVTVYRTLALLSELGYIRRVHFEDGCHGYARTELAHGHHLVCKGCQQVIEFPGTEDLTTLARKIAQMTGFVIEEHMLELLGVCPLCQ